MKLTPDELDIALQILEKEGCSDFFPVPFEVHAIRSNWDKIKPVLEKVDLLSYSPTPAERIMAPKQLYTVRPVLFIDPIDSLLLLSLIVRIGSRIESARVPKGLATIYSHRYMANRNGSLFDPHDEYREFNIEIDRMLQQRKYVAVTDIVDFYSRVYLHRLENALVAMLRNDQESRVVMRFLEAWSEGTSYGIPAGPHFSGFLAEALLHEVDEYLISQRVRFVRYIDDIYLFGDTEGECLRALFLLGERLQSTQGLSLNSAKTKICEARTLLQKRLGASSPDEEIHRKVIRLVFGGNPYAVVNYSALRPEQKLLVDQLDVKRMIDRALADSPLTDFSSIRFALNVLSALNRPELVDPVLDNLGKLYPVAHSVARFLNVFESIGPEEQKRIGGRILHYLQDPACVSDFQIMWLLEPFTKGPGWNHLTELRAIARDHRHSCVRRQAVLALGQAGDRSALLDVKTRVHVTHTWERRAIIYACRALPADERKAFYTHLKVDGDWKLPNLMDKAVLAFVR